MTKRDPTLVEEVRSDGRSDDRYLASEGRETDGSSRPLEEPEARGEEVTGAETVLPSGDGVDPSAFDLADLDELPATSELEFGRSRDICEGDDREAVDSPNLDPWRRVCQLIVDHANGARSRATGWFIGPRTVMTAGHVVFTRRQGGWAKRIEVVPGMHRDSAPYGRQISTESRSVAPWLERGDKEHDYGAVILPDDTLGTRVGCFGFTTLTDEELSDLPVVNAGYSSDKRTGTQWSCAGRVTDHSERQLFYLIDTFNGNSGGPVWMERDGKRLAIGVHAYGGCPNRATRITPAMFELMRRWKET